MTHLDPQMQELHNLRAEADQEVQKFTQQARRAQHEADSWAGIRSLHESAIKSLAERRLEEQRAKPAEPPHRTDGKPTAVIFSRPSLIRGVDRVHYAAVCVRPDHWYIGAPARRNPAPVTWEGVLRFVGQENWGTIHQYTGTKQLAPVRVASLGDEQRAYAWLDIDGDRWEHRNGEWAFRDGNDPEFDEDDWSDGLYKPTAQHGPFTRIEA